MHWSFIAGVSFFAILILVALFAWLWELRSIQKKDSDDDTPEGTLPARSKRFYRNAIKFGSMNTRF